VTVDEILECDDLAPLMAAWLLDDCGNECGTIFAFEGIFYFFGRIYGGGLSHAIGAAPDEAIPECLSLIRKYGSPKLVDWAARLERYFPDGLLHAPKLTREDWESEYMECAPVPAFEDLEAEVYGLELELGNAVCGFVREHVDAFRRSEAGKHLQVDAEARPTSKSTRLPGSSSR